MFIIAIINIANRSSLNDICGFKLIYVDYYKKPCCDLAFNSMLLVLLFSFFTKTFFFINCACRFSEKLIVLIIYSYNENV